MSKPLLALVQSREPDDLFTVSPEANRQIEDLPEVERLRIVDGLSRAYYKAVGLLVQMKMNPYSSLEENLTLMTLANETTVFAVDGYALRVKICSKSLRVHLISVGLPGSLRPYDVHKMR